MASKKAPILKKGKNSSARSDSKKRRAGAVKRAKIPAATLKQLKALVKRHRGKDLRASWKLGELAQNVLDGAMNEAGRLSTRDLAERIELIPKIDPSSPSKRPDDATLRQLLKFARLATKQQANALHKVGVAWRGIVFWLGVDDTRQRTQLYERITAGLTNSPEIRRYIAERYKKPAPPRRHVDLARMCKKTLEVSEQLAGTLNHLHERLAGSKTAGWDGNTKKVQVVFGELVDSLDETARLAKATCRRIRVVS